MPRIPLRHGFMAAAVFALALAACTDDGPVGPAADVTPAVTAAPEGPAAATETSDGVLLGRLDLLSCQSLAPDSVRVRVGPEGGVVQVGPHRLVIPAGALHDTVTITAHLPSGPTNSVRFGPHGLTFDPAHRPLLTMSYANCALLGKLLPKRIVYATDDLASLLSVLQSVDLLLRQEVTAPLDHFSRYAIAW